MAFNGFAPAALTFLSDLAQHNDRDWFEAHREVYESELLAPARAFVTAVGPHLQNLDPEVQAEPRAGGAIFRIHRDTRFAKDKRPYKEELAFRFVPELEGASGFYMRIRPDVVGIAIGAWSFGPEALRRYRQAVGSDAYGPELAEQVEGLKRNGCGFTADPLKRVPAPWPADHPREELLRARGMVLGFDFPVPPCLGSSAFVEWCVAHWVRLAPIHHWLRRHATG